MIRATPTVPPKFVDVIRASLGALKNTVIESLLADEPAGTVRETVMSGNVVPAVAVPEYVHV